MNGLKKTRSTIFVYLMCFLLSKELLFQNEFTHVKFSNTVSALFVWKVMPKETCLESSILWLTLKAQQNCGRWHSGIQNFIIIFFFSEKIRLDTSCESSARQMIHI